MGVGSGACWTTPPRQLQTVHLALLSRSAVTRPPRLGQGWGSGRAGAGGQASAASPADEHGLSAFGALNIGGLDLLACRLLGQGESLLQGVLELLDYRLRAQVAVCDVVELVLRAGSEADVDEILEVLDQ